MNSPAQLVVQHPAGRETWHNWPRSLLVPRPGDHIRLDDPNEPDTDLEVQVTDIVHILSEQAGQLTTYIHATPIGELTDEPA